MKTAIKNVMHTAQQFILRHKIYFTGYVISFLVFFNLHGEIVEDYYEVVFLFIGANIAGLFSWCYIAQKVLLLII